MQTAFGALLRGAGGNQAAIARAAGRCCASRSPPTRSPACSAVLAGMALVGVTTSADANMANSYTLLSSRARSWAGRVHRRAHLADRRRHRRAHAAACRRRAEFLSSAGATARLPHPPRMAGRRAGDHPHPDPGRPGDHQPERAMTEATYALLSRGSNQPYLWSFVGTLGVYGLASSSREDMGRGMSSPLPSPSPPSRC